MNASAESSWSTSAPELYDHAMTDTHDFAAPFLDLGNIDIDFNSIIDHNGEEAVQDGRESDSLHSQHLSRPDIPYSEALNPTAAHQQHGLVSPANVQEHGAGYVGYNMGQYQQVQQAQQRYSMPQGQMYNYRGVPTPNSVEMHSDPGRYLHQLDTQQAILDQQLHFRKEDVSTDCTGIPTLHR
jgi:hypothetical protein